MFSLILAAALTTGSDTPAFGFHGGCHGCCGGCCGGCFGCYGCCGGCGGCWGCYGCCGGCWGCYGCCGGCWGCYGCCGGCWGCYGCCGGCWGCSGCYGCYGGYYPAVVAAPVVVASGQQGGGAGGGTGGGAGGTGGGAGGSGGSGGGSGGGGSGGGSGGGAGQQQQQPNLPAPNRQTTLGNSARLIVKAPTDARVTVNGYETRRTATEEGFITPALEPGVTYTYEVRAEATRDGRPVVIRQQVKVQAGQESVADFTELNVPSGDSGQVTVVLPSEADLFIDGVRCPLTSGRRTFTTPALQPGRSYYYTLRAEVVRDGQRYRQNRRVEVEAGKAVTVEFDRLGVQSASR